MPPPSSQPSDSAPGDGRSPARWWPLVAVGLAALALARTRGIGLIGLDTLPILHTADFPGALHQRLMPNHNMYRPVLSLSVWLDQALFGLWAPGFQLSSALAYLFACLALGLAARRLVGSPLAALVAVLVFGLHPSQVDVVPFVERRSELLMVGFLGLAVAAWARLARATPTERGAGLRAQLGATALALLAMGSKDNGLVALPLGLATLFACAPGGLARRAGRVLRTGWPLVVATALFGLWRGRIVGGFGGRSDRDPLALIGEHPAQVLELTDRALRPEPFASTSPVTGALLAGAALALALAWWLGRRRADERAPERLGTPGRAVLIALVWIEGFLITYAARGVWRIWYVLPLAAGLALGLAAAAELLASRWRAARGTRPVLAGAAAAGLALLAASVAWQARYGVALGDLGPCRERTRRLEAFYGELARRVDAEGPGVVIQVPEFPATIETPPGPGYYDNVRDVTKTTVRAYMWLAYPGERVRLRPAGEEPRTRDPGDYLLVHPEF